MKLVHFAHESHGQPGGLTDIAENRFLADNIAVAAGGDADACFDLGVTFSTGSNGCLCDFVEAHKWFNLAALAGHDGAADCRAEVADEMTAREIATAQRLAREWLQANAPRRAA